MNIKEKHVYINNNNSKNITMSSNSIFGFNNSKNITCEKFRIQTIYFGFMRLMELFNPNFMLISGIEGKTEQRARG